MTEFPRGLMVTGTGSGVGKTTLSFTLMALLREKGFKVQPFKIGPDYIDGGYHRLASGRPSINLDLWMMGWKGLEESFRRYSTGDVSVVEGMGALYDGQNGTRAGSSAQIAKRLNLPVVLVMDIWGSTLTTGAMLQGILDFDRKLSIAAVILNRAGSHKHYQMVLQALKPALKRKVIGYLTRSREKEIPERHLGLKTLEENSQAPAILQSILASGRKTLDIAKLIRLLRLKKTNPKGVVSPALRGEVRLGVARDEAFCFYYAENLRMLQEAGAELVYFSPLKDRLLPADVDGLYLGGGYPESFLEKLSAHSAMRRSLLAKIQEGMPVYAECGGLMYLSQSITGFDGKTFPMVGALPLRIQMDSHRMTLRYVRIQTKARTLLGPAGVVARGHEFHYSRIISNGYRGGFLYQGVNSSGIPFKEGYVVRRLLASYCHLHFKSNPLLPAYWIESCWNYHLERQRPV